MASLLHIEHGIATLAAYLQLKSLSLEDCNCYFTMFLGIREVSITDI